MALMSLHEVSVSYGVQVLLEKAELHIEPNERVCLVGRNGAGKSTLMRILAGEIEPDSGTVARAQDLTVTGLPQEVPLDMHGRIYDIVISGLDKWQKILSEYHDVCAGLENDVDGSLMNRLHELQQALDTEGGWQLEKQVQVVISHMGLDADSEFSTLSAGMKRRVLLAKALVSKPDILLLDEPTNHLDIDSIDWLEGFLSNYDGTLFFITHDRLFSEKMATRIIDLDRGALKSFGCSYSEYIAQKEAALELEEKQNEQFDKKLAEEEAWIRKGIKARRTRNEGRVRELQKLRRERSQRRERESKVRMEVEQAEKSGKMVAKLHNISYQYENGPLIVKDFSTMVTRGDRIGIIGPNGVGKSTLIRLILGELEPQQGKVKLGTNLEVAYFDQLRETLDESQSLGANVGGGSDTITINKKNRHIIGYLQDFLFTPEQVRSPIKYLSGGERNRLLLAKLFTKPSNVLVLDEPTNDLDVDTLELLEELLMEYEGTVLLVSHDRAFLNNVVTATYVLDGKGNVKEYAGGYDDYLFQKAASEESIQKEKAAAPKKTVSDKPKKAGPKKISYKDKLELEKLPAQIEALETEQSDIHEKMSDPKLYQEAGEKVVEFKNRLSEIENDLEKLYLRWEELEG